MQYALFKVISGHVAPNLYEC